MLTSLQIDRIVRYAQKHRELTQKQIGEKFGISQCTVSHLMLDRGHSRRALGEQCRFWNQQPERAALLEKMLRNNPDMNHQAIGDRMGLTADQVHAFAVRRGIPHRTKQGPPPGTRRGPLAPEHLAALRAGWKRWASAIQHAV